MKILLVNQTFFPDEVATAQQIADLAAELVRRGASVTVVASRNSYENPKIKHPKTGKFKGVEIHRVRSTSFGKLSFLHRVVDGVTFEFFTLLKLLTLPRHEVIVSFTSPPLLGLIGLFVGWVKGSLTSQWLMDVNPDAAIEVGYLRKGSLIAQFLQAIFGFSLRRTHSITVLDRWMRERIKSYGVSENRISIVPPWSVFEPSRDRLPQSPYDNPARKEFGLEGKFIVLFSGNHSIVHPLDALLIAALRLRHDDQIRFVFMGSGLRVQDVAAFKERNQLNNIIQLPAQPRAKVQATLSMANVHALVMGEGMSGLVHTSKIYGILATGRPYIFIGPRKSHVMDLIHENPYGFQVEQDQMDELIEKIRSIQSFDAAKYAEFEKENQKYLLQKCTFQHSFAAFEEDILSLPQRMAAESTVT